MTYVFPEVSALSFVSKLFFPTRMPPPMNDHIFLFEFVNEKTSLTARDIHIRRLYDVIQLSIQRDEYLRARRAFGILARCKEIKWKDLWKLALLLLADSEELPTSKDGSLTRLEFLRMMMLQHREDASTLYSYFGVDHLPLPQRETIFQELVLLLVLTGKYKEALDELQLYEDFSLLSGLDRSHPSFDIVGQVSSILPIPRQSCSACVCRSCMP